MKMLFKGHSTRLEMLIEKIHSNKENSYQDSDLSGSSSSEIRPTSAENLAEINLDSPKSQCYSDTEEEKEWDDIKTIGTIDISKSNWKIDCDKVEGSISPNYSCNFCPRQFKHKRSRDRHIKLHTGDKKYKCLQCDSAFARSDHLKIHLKTHDMKKFYKCNICHKSYTTMSALCVHGKCHEKECSNSAEHMPSSDPERLFTNIQKSESVQDSNISQKKSRLWTLSDNKPDIKTVCVYCFQWFSSIELMLEHVQLCHRTFGHDFDDQKNFFQNDYKGSKDTFLRFNYRSESPTSKKSKQESSSEHISLQQNHYEEPLSSQDTFICACCYERFPNFKRFLIHMETHVSSVKNQTCQMCGEELKDATSNQNSKELLVPLNNYQCCCHCDSLFLDTDKLQAHLLDQHVITTYKCAICDQTFNEISSLKMHLTSEHVKNREHFECGCSENPQVFHDRISAELHFSEYHGTLKNSSNHECKANGILNEILVKKEFPEDISQTPCFTSGIAENRCVYCKEYCKSKNDLQLHLRSHQISEKTRHKCNICDDLFTTSTELASHKLIHCKIIEGNMCVQCKTVILDEESFIKHQIKHNDNSKSTTKLNLILPSICIVCGQTLQSDQEIELHAKFHLKFLSDPTKSSRVSESPYTEESLFPSEQSRTFRSTIDSALELQCHLCKKSFTIKEKLQIHLIEHNFFGINHFSCYICSAVFTGAAALQSHLLEHNMAEKPYQCSQCSAAFFFRAELDNHKYLHNFNLQFNYLTEESVSYVKRFANSLSTDSR